MGKGLGRGGEGGGWGSGARGDERVWERNVVWEKVGWKERM